MAIESVTSKIQGQQIAGQGVGLTLADAQTQKTQAPILGGKSLTVTDGAMTDLEKLVAMLKNENENAKMSVSQRRISILQTVLDSMNNRITEAQRNAILDIETLNAEKAELDRGLVDLNAAKTAGEGRIALLDEQIAALEKQIEQAVEDGADHREQVAKLKAQRAEEQAKLDQINVAIDSTAAKIAEVDGKIAKCTDTIGAVTLSEVSAALRAAASEYNPEVERPESDAERKKAEAKIEATDIAKCIRESLDKIDAQIRQVLDETQMKVEG